jgi:uncharacterized protein YndB with AHSA1/START domain
VPAAPALRSYSFLTTWILDAPREPVWDAIWDSERWPEWWRGVKSVVEIEPGDPDGVGKLSRYTWRSRLPYDLSFDMRTTRVEVPHLIEGEASGELAGTGRWRLFAENSATAITYEWNVGTTMRWMNAIAPLARPALEWNHDWVMRKGGTGLASLLGCRLLATD